MANFHDVFHDGYCAFRITPYPTHSVTVEWAIFFCRNAKKIAISTLSYVTLLMPSNTRAVNGWSRSKNNATGIVYRVCSLGPVRRMVVYCSRTSRCGRPRHWCHSSRCINTFFTTTMGRLQVELAKGVRSWPTSTRYILFYLPSVSGITVLRVLHHARGIQNIQIDI